MQKTIGLPDWFNRDLTSDQEDVVPIMTAVMGLRSGTPLFTGAIAEFFRSYKVPGRIDIAFDMEQMAAIARMEFKKGGDGRASDKGWRVLYGFFDIESFALLWNGEYPVVHGMPASTMSLSLNPNDDTWPIQVGGEQADLGFADGRFYFQRHVPDQDQETDQ